MTIEKQIKLMDNIFIVLFPIATYFNLIEFYKNGDLINFGFISYFVYCFIDLINDKYWIKDQEQ